jgi:hypothetical protein
MYIYKMFFPHCSAMSASYNQVSINVFWFMLSALLQRFIHPCANATLYIFVSL